MRDASLRVRTARTLDLQSPTSPGRPSFLSAASGLVRSGGQLYVVADDELQLGCFSATGDKPGTLLRLFKGNLPLRPKARKKRKADLEILLRLPPLPAHPRGALLALGSGSGSRRRRGALVSLDARGQARTVATIDAAPLYAQLTRQFDDLNLEGGWLDGDSLCLLQRGNRGNSPNAVIELDYAAVIAGLARRELPGLVPRRVTEVDLGAIDGIPLGFTDACSPAAGLWLYSAVAEDTNDARADGACVGAVIGVATRADGILWQRRIAPTFKIEGIDATLRAGRLEISCVTDADDPAAPARLLRLSAPAPAAGEP